MHQYATLEDTVYLYFASNDTSGSGGDGASALADVREGGAAASAIPTLSPTPALLTHANYPAGCYEVAVAATAANGFSADKTYAVFATLAVDSQNPTGLIGSFRLSTVPADMVKISGDTTAADNAEADYDGTGYAKANSTIGTTTTNTDMVTEPPTVAEIQAEIEENGASLLDTIRDELANGTDGLSALKTLIDAIKSETALIVADSNELQTDDVPGLIAALNNLSSANVLTQVNAALDAAIPELGVAAPTATPTLRTGLMLPYMALRNKTVVQTSGTDALEIYNNAGTKIASKLLTDDGSDYEEAEMS